MYVLYLCVCSGGNEVFAADPAAVVESDTDSKQSRSEVADTKRAVPGQRFSSFVGFWT